MNGESSFFHGTLKGSLTQMLFKAALLITLPITVFERFTFVVLFLTQCQANLAFHE